MANVKLSNVIRRAQTKVDKDNTDLIFYVGGEHIVSENIRVQSRGIIAESTIGPMFYYGFKAGDFLLVSRNPHLKKAGLVDFDGICSEKTFVLETADSDVLLPEFLPFVLQNERFWDYAYRHRHGSTNTFINWSTLANYEFELPDLETQRKLAEVLWSINDTMDAYKKLISAANELVKSQFMEQFGDPKTNSNQLTMRPLGEVCMVERGGSPRPIAKFVTDAEDGINWIKIGDADGTRYISSTAEKIIPEGIKKSRMVQAGDLILSNSMSFGHPYILKIDGCIHDGWLVLHFDKTVFDALYLQTYLGLPAVYAIFETMAAGGVVNNLNSEIVKKLPVIVPTMDQQKQFAAFVRQSDKSKFAALSCSNLNLNFLKL